MATPKFARVMRTNLKKATIDEAAAEWHRHIAPFKKTGLERAYMLVDRGTGAYLSVTIWENKEAQTRNVVSPGQVAGRTSMTSLSEAQRPSWCDMQMPGPTPLATH